MRIRLALVAITAVAISVVSCTPERQSTHGGFPECGPLPTPVACIETEWVDSEGVGSGTVFYPDGQARLTNFWPDGTHEQY